MEDLNMADQGLRRELVQRYRWPEPLAKAVEDQPWSYTLRLSSGEVIEFSGAEPADPNREWVKLIAHTYGGFPGCPADAGLAGRGLVVRVSEIVWCFDEDS